MINVRNKKFLLALGKHLRSIRESKGISQAQLSYTADVSFNQIGRIERGEVNVTASTLFAISKALEISLTEVFNFEYK